MIVLLIRYDTYSDRDHEGQEIFTREWAVLDKGFWDTDDDELVVDRYDQDKFDFDGPRDAAKEFVKRHYPDMRVLHVGRLPDSRHSIATLEPDDPDPVRDSIGMSDAALKKLSKEQLMYLVKHEHDHGRVARKLAQDWEDLYCSTMQKMQHE
tara:strand:+ start:1355 stop:1810 length:456 start_codon:yes stop_codon:yes gene_type:complete